jgi:hypothetical protein
MNFSERLDALQERVAVAKTAVLTASSESREQLGKRIDQAQGELNENVTKAQQRAGEAADHARTTWSQMRADAAAKIEDAKAKIERRTRELDAKAAGREANQADANAADAIDFAEWALDSAELAILDAIDAHAYADERARAASS